MLLSSALRPHHESHYRRGARCSIDDKYNKHRGALMIMAGSLRILLRWIEASRHYSRTRQKLRCLAREWFCRRTTRRGCKSRPTATGGSAVRRGKASGGKIAYGTGNKWDFNRLNTNKRSAPRRWTGAKRREKSSRKLTLPLVVCADLRRCVVFSFPTIWTRRTFQFNFQMGRTKAYLWNVHQEWKRARRLSGCARDERRRQDFPSPPASITRPMSVSGSLPVKDIKIIEKV